MNYCNLEISFGIDSALFSIINIGTSTIDSAIPRHCHSRNSYEIHYISSGDGYLITNQGSYEIHPNTLYVTGPNFEHEQIVKPNGSMNEACIYMEVKKSTEHSGNHVEKLSDLFLDTIFWFGQDQQNIGSLFLSLMQELEDQMVGYDINAKCLVQQMIIDIVRNYNANLKSQTVITTKDLSNNRFLAIEVAFLNDYRDITLNSLAERLGICTRQAERLIEKHYSMNFSQKRIQARSAAAKSMLRNTDLSISEIAEAIGFSSAEHFSTVFKRYNQVTPKKYRDLIKNLMNPSTLQG